MLVISLIITGTVIGQPGNNGGERKPERDQKNRPHQPMVPDSTQIIKQVDELSSILSLTENKKDTVLNIHLSHFSKIRQLIKESGNNHESTRSKMESLRKEFLDEMKSILSEEQYEKFEAFMKKHKPRSRPEKRRKI